MAVPEPTRHVILQHNLLQNQSTNEPMLAIVRELIATAAEKGNRIWYTASTLNLLRGSGQTSGVDAANALEQLHPGGLVTPSSVPGYQPAVSPAEDMINAAAALVASNSGSVHLVRRSLDDLGGKLPTAVIGHSIIDGPSSGLPGLGEALGFERYGTESLRDRVNRTHISKHPAAAGERRDIEDDIWTSSREHLPDQATVSSNLPVDLVIDVEQVPNELGSMLLAATAARQHDLRIHFTRRSAAEPGTELADFAASCHVVDDDMAVAADEVKSVYGTDPGLRTVVTDRQLTPEARASCNAAGFSVRDGLDETVAWLLHQDPTRAHATVDRAALLAGPVDEPTYLRRLRDIAPLTSAAAENPRLNAWENDAPLERLAPVAERQPLAIVVPRRTLMSQSDDTISPLRALLDACEDEKLIATEWPVGDPPTDTRDMTAEKAACSDVVSRITGGQVSELTRLLLLHPEPEDRYVLKFPIEAYTGGVHKGMVLPVEFLDEFLRHEPDRAHRALRKAFTIYHDANPGPRTETAAAFANALAGDPIGFGDYRAKWDREDHDRPVHYRSKVKYCKTWSDAVDNLRAEVFATCLGRREESDNMELSGDEQKALYGKRRKLLGHLEAKRDRPALSRFDVARPLVRNPEVPFPDTAPPRPPTGEVWDGKPRRTPSLEQPRQPNIQLRTVIPSTLARDRHNRLRTLSARRNEPSRGGRDR